MDKSISADYPAHGGAAPDSQPLHKVGRATRRVIGCMENAILVNPKVASLFCCFLESL